MILHILFDLRFWRKFRKLYWLHGFWSECGFFQLFKKAWVWTTTDCGRVQKSQFNFWESAMHQKHVFSLYTNFKHFANFGRIPGQETQYFTWLNSLGKRKKAKVFPTGKLLLIWIPGQYPYSMKAKAKILMEKSLPLSIRESCCLYSNFFGLFSISHFRLIPIFFNIWLQTLQIPRHFSNLYLSLWCHTLLHPWDEFSILENSDDTEASKNNIWSKTRNSGFHLFENVLKWLTY